MDCEEAAVEAERPVRRSAEDQDPVRQRLLCVSSPLFKFFSSPRDGEVFFPFCY